MGVLLMLATACSDEPAGSEAISPSFPGYDDYQMFEGESSFLRLGFAEDSLAPGIAALVVRVDDDRVGASEVVEFAADVIFEDPIAMELTDGWLVGAHGCTDQDSSCSTRALHLFHLDADGSNVRPLDPIDDEMVEGYGFRGQVGESSVVISARTSEPGPPSTMAGTLGATRILRERYLVHDLSTGETVQLAWLPDQLADPVGGSTDPVFTSPHRSSCVLQDRLWVLDSVPSDGTFTHTLTTIALEPDAAPRSVPVSGPTGEQLASMVCASDVVQLLSVEEEQRRITLTPLSADGELGTPSSGTFNGTEVIGLQVSGGSVLLTSTDLGPDGIPMTERDNHLLAHRDGRWEQAGVRVYPETVRMSGDGNSILISDGETLSGRSL